MSPHLHADVLRSKGTLVRAWKSQKVTFTLCVSVCWEWKSKINSTVFALLGPGSTPSHAAQHCLILSMSFSISEPQFPHLLVDRAGLDHL